MVSAGYPLFTKTEKKMLIVSGAFIGMGLVLLIIHLIIKAAKGDDGKEGSSSSSSQFSETDAASVVLVAIFSVFFAIGGVTILIFFVVWNSRTAKQDYLVRQGIVPTPQAAANGQAAMNGQAAANGQV